MPRVWQTWTPTGSATGLDRRLEHPTSQRRDVVVTFADRAPTICTRRSRPNHVSATFR
jgi:hypothetical protein